MSRSKQEVIVLVTILCLVLFSLMASAYNCTFVEQLALGENLTRYEEGLLSYCTEEFYQLDLPQDDAELFCSETDGGEDLSLQGTSSLYVGGNLTNSSTDYCMGDGQLVEFSCSNGTYGWGVFTCGENLSCFDGACVQECSDTDPTDDHYFYGESNLSNGSLLADYCDGAFNLYQYNCEEEKYKQISCLWGCSAGACLIQINETETETYNETFLGGENSSTEEVSEDYALLLEENAGGGVSKGSGKSLLGEEEQLELPDYEITGEEVTLALGSQTFEASKEIPFAPHSCLDGCFVNGGCIPVGSRVMVEEQGFYCAESLELVLQLESGAICEHDLSCQSNICQNNSCILEVPELSFWQKITQLMRHLFS